MHIVLNKICYSLLYKSLHSRKNLNSLRSDVRMTITCNIEISTKFNARTYAGVTSFKKYLTYLLSDSVQLRKVPIPMQILVFSGTDPFKLSLNMKNIISTTTFIQFIKNIFSGIICLLVYQVSKRQCEFTSSRILNYTRCICGNNII